MKAGIIMTGSGPILILTTYDAFTADAFVDKLKAKGITKFIAYDVSIEKIKERYGLHFPIVMNDLKQTDDLRVLDYNGHHVMNNFSFAEMGQPVFYE